jgi:hypothetical protein
MKTILILVSQNQIIALILIVALGLLTFCSFRKYFIDFSDEEKVSSIGGAFFVTWFVINVLMTLMTLAGAVFFIMSLN